MSAPLNMPITLTVTLGSLVQCFPNDAQRLSASEFTQQVKRRFGVDERYEQMELTYTGTRGLKVLVTELSWFKAIFVGQLDLKLDPPSTPPVRIKIGIHPRYELARMPESLADMYARARRLFVTIQNGDHLSVWLVHGGEFVRIRTEAEWRTVAMAHAREVAARGTSGPEGFASFHVKVESRQQPIVPAPPNAHLIGLQVPLDPAEEENVPPYSPANEPHGGI